ncbi:MAG: trypsin-like peptidase domain-containing protein [Oscillospiraceae bacterium]|nr:trypsin-like peptidase domain-containing protein [Oscillospiraceae bacterium]
MYDSHDFNFEVYRRQRKPRRNGGKTVLIVLLFVLISASAGFAGGLVMTLALPNWVGGGAVPQPLEHLQLISETYAELGGVTVGDEDNFSGIIPLTTGEAQLTAPEVARIVTPSVVEIQTEVVTSAGRVEQVREGAGSGVIISADGYIVTNSHVIAGARAINVRLNDGRQHSAELIADDPRSDLALLKIEADDLTPAVFGDSDMMMVAEPVLAVGNPLGALGGTVTGGLISATDRDIIIAGELMTLLQTDAAVNRGNSGGGLFNMRGELIGIVNAKSGGPDVEGLGFAIPTNTASQVIDDLFTYGFVRGRVDTGFALVDIQTPMAAMRYNVGQAGLYIADSVHSEFRQGDRITAIDGRAVTNLTSFNAALASRAVGDSVSVTVARGNENVTHSIVLVEFRP